MPKAPDATADRMSLFEDLKRAVQIDKNDLDTCFIEQSDLFYRVSEQYTLARSLQDEIKYEITQLEATLSVQFRSETDGDKKPPSVDAVRAQVMSSPKMVDLQKEMMNAAAKVGKWAALKEAFDMRASMLKSLGSLYATDYFQTRTIQRPQGEARDRAADTVRSEAGEERRNREPRVRPTRND